MKKILLVTMCAALMVTATPLEGMKGSIISAVDLARGAANVSVAAAGTVGLFVVAGLVTYTFWGCTVWPAYYYYDSGRHGGSGQRHLVWPILPPFKPIFDSMRSVHDKNK